MKVLVVLCHPDITESSYNHSIYKTVVESLKESGNEIKTSDLYKMGFLAHPSSLDFEEDPKVVPYSQSSKSGKLLPEILEEQNKVDWCTHLIIIGPIYWGTLPSVFSSWFERVFTAGKAYDMQHLYENGYFKGKKALIISTSGGPKVMYEPISTHGSVDFRLLQITCGSLWFCGIQPLRTIHLFSVPYVPQELRIEWLNKLKIVIKKLDEMEPIKFNPTGIKSEKTNWDIVLELGQWTIDDFYNKYQ